MTPACDRCDDTGSLSKRIDGYMDCVFCNAPQERAELEAWAFNLINEHGAAAALWMTYLRGRAARAEQPAGVASDN